MAWDKRFFLQPRLTSKLKHLVLQAYVKEFAYHLGSARPVVYYVDGFAGAGVYLLGATTEDGSPLLIARLAEQIKASSRPFDLRCVNVESKPRRYESLEKMTKPFQPHIVEKNYRGSFVDVIPDVIQRVGAAPTFFFIDPFGTKDIAFSRLMPIFKRRNTTEVLITLQTDGIAKKAGWFAREDDADPKRQAVARKLITHLAEALDVSVQELRKAWKETGERGDTTQFENRALQYYLRKLRSVGFVFTKAFKVLYYHADTLRERPVCFHLVFATRHEQGLFKMNDAMVDALTTFYRNVYSDSFFSTFEAERERLLGAAAVKTEIEKLFSSKSSFTIDDVKRHCMQNTDFLLKGSEYRKLVLQMVETGALKKLTKGALSNAGTRFEFVRPG